MNKKYKLTNVTKECRGRVLFRIQSLIDIPRHDVLVGALGGFVESEDNLSHEGCAWIADDAVVYDVARISGNALICDNAQVFNTARIFGDAKIYDKARIFEDAEVFCDAEVFNWAKVCDHVHVFRSAKVSGEAEVSGDGWVHQEQITRDFFVRDDSACEDKGHNSSITEQRKKYELTDETKMLGDIKLYRIRALKPLRTRGVGTGDKGLGGWVQSEDNLSHDGSAWISCDAMVWGNARVHGCTWIRGQAQVYDSAQVYDGASLNGLVIVRDNAQVYGHAYATDDVIIRKNAKVHGHARLKGAIIVQGNEEIG